jgi:Protein of unknown function (DUF4233)
VRTLASSVLVGEAFVLFFATLVATDLADVSDGAAWAVGGGAAVLSLAVTALLRFRWAYVAGSLLQVLVVAAGLVVPVMFFLGAVFAALWVLALVLGRRVARLQAGRPG